MNEYFFFFFSTRTAAVSEGKIDNKNNQAYTYRNIAMTHQ